MDYSIEIKEEPLDESYEVHQELKANDDLPQQNYTANSHVPPLHNNVKVESEFETGVTEVETGTTNNLQVADEVVNRKRKSSNALLNILSPNGQINHNTSNGSGSTKRKKLPPTLTSLLNRSNTICTTQNTVPVELTQTAILTDTTDVPNTNPSTVGKSDKPTLQKMLSSPWSGQSPLLSSMLKSPYSVTSRTNSTIDKLFNSVPVTVGSDTNHVVNNSSLLSMLGHQNNKPGPITSNVTHRNINEPICSSQNILVHNETNSVMQKFINSPPVTLVTMVTSGAEGKNVANNSTLSMMLGHQKSGSGSNQTIQNPSNNSDIDIGTTQSKFPDSNIDWRKNESVNSPSITSTEGKNVDSKSLPSICNGSQNIIVDQGRNTSINSNLIENGGIQSKCHERSKDSNINKLLTNNQDISKNIGSNTPISGTQAQTVMRMPCSSGTGSKEILLPSVKTGDFENTIKEIKTLPKEFQSEQFIDMWTNIITQKVISEFSKDVNATLNSFVKKAIMDSLSGTQNTSEETGTQMSGGAKKIPEQKSGMNQVSSLASSLLNSLTEKVGECSLPNIHVGDKTKQKPEIVEPPDNDTIVILDDDDNEEQEDKNAWKKSKLFGKFTVDSLETPTSESLDNENMNTEFSWPYSNSPSTNPYIVTKFKGVVKKTPPSQNKPISTTPVVQSLSTIPDNLQTTNSNQILSNQMGTIKTEAPDIELSAAAQMVLHPIRGPDGKYLVYSCNICGKRFQHHGTLSVHQRTHLLESGQSDYKCDICGKVCTAKRYLDIHMKTHQPEACGPKVTCEICGKDFTSEENLIIHKRLHSGEKLYQCEVCHTGFTRNSQLSIHMRIHSGEKPYICNICGKSFRQSNGLSLHMNVHTDDKPFKCEICGLGFSRKAHYVKHMRKERGERPFKCTECGKGFTDKFNLTMHTRTHQKDKPHVCQICGKGYVQNTHLRNHLKFHTGEKGYSCPYCGERFEIKKVLQSHLNSVHKDREDTLTANRPRRNTTKSFKVDQYNHTDEEEVIDTDSNSSNGIEQKERGAGYSDMIMHITQGFGDSTNEEIGDLNQDYSEGLTNTTGLYPDVSNVKVEPIEFEFSSGSIKSSLGGNTLLDFDPTQIKEEPEDYMEDDLGDPSSNNQSEFDDLGDPLSNNQSEFDDVRDISSNVQSEFDEKTIKTEPIDT